MAQTGGDDPVPEDARPLLPESRWIDLYCKEARWQVHAADQSITDIETTLTGLSSDLRVIDADVDLPDFDAMRTRLNNALSVVCESETAREARDAALSLRDQIQLNIAARFDELTTELQNRIEVARETMAADIRLSVNNLFESERISKETRLQQEFDADVARRLNELGRDPTPNDIDAAESSARAFVTQLAEQLEAEVEQQARMLADSLHATSQELLTNVSEDLNALSARLRNRTASTLSATAQTARIEALVARRDALLVIVDWRIQQFQDRVRPHMAGIPGDQFTAAQLVLDQIAIDRDQFSQALGNAISSNNRAAFDAALANFQENWAARQADFEATRVSSRLTCNTISDEVEVALANVRRLANALPDEAELPPILRTDLGAIRDALEAAEGAGAEFETACAADEFTGADLREVVQRMRLNVAEANEGLARFRAAVEGGAR